MKHFKNNKQCKNWNKKLLIMVLKNLPNYHLAQDKNCSESYMKKMLKLKNSTILDISNVIKNDFYIQNSDESQGKIGNKSHQTHPNHNSTEKIHCPRFLFLLPKLFLWRCHERSHSERRKSLFNCMDRMLCFFKCFSSIFTCSIHDDLHSSRMPIFKFSHIVDCIINYHPCVVFVIVFSHFLPTVLRKLW